MSAMPKPQGLSPEQRPDAATAALAVSDVEGLEAAHIDAWRQRAGIAGDAATAGLAFSGGGIRSATLGLGVLEAMRDLKLLARYDYFSSVSGGGYIMAWLSAHCHRDADWLGAGQQNVDRWDASIAHLSRYSNYLSPRLGIFSADSWTMLTVWARNAFLVQLTVVCGIVLALLFPRFAMEWFISWPKHGAARWLTIGVFVCAVLCIAANQLQQRHRACVKVGCLAQARPCLAWLGVAAGLFAAAGCGALARYLWQASQFDPFPASLPIGAPAGMLVRLGAPAVPIALLMLVGALAVVAALVCVRALLGAARERRRGTAQPQAGLPGTGLPDAGARNHWPDFGQGSVQWLIVIPLLVTSVEFSAVLWNAVARSDGPLEYGDVLLYGLGYWPFPLSFAFSALLVLACCSLKRWSGRKSRLRLPRIVFNLFLIAVSTLVCIVVLHATFAGIVVLMKSFQKVAGPWHAFVWGPTMLLSAFASAVTLMIGLLGRASMEGMREWWSRLAAWLWIYAIAWDLLAMSAVYGPTLLPWLVKLGSWKQGVPLAGWLGTTVAGLLAASSGATKGDNKIRSRESTPKSAVLEVIARVAPAVFIVGLLLAVATAISMLLVKVDGGVLVDPHALAQCQPGKCWSTFLTHMAMPGAGLGMTALVAALLLLLLAWRIDINEFSLQAFYRSRLVRCYLGASRARRSPQKFTQFDDDDDLRVAALGRKPGAWSPGAAGGPLHLINCTVNLGGSKDLSLHTRHGASFTITPYGFGSGSPINGNGAIGFRRHDYYRNGGMTLGEAMATSGAAASPNQGFHTSPSAAFMMTMFNARLGRWCANPRFDNTYMGPWFSLRYLVNELFGTASECSKYLMISDGGHFENLGAYELVRRRCKLIVIVDAECDPGMHFGALGTLIRLVQVDFNTRIDLDVKDLKLAPETRLSKAHSAVGRIAYPADGQGRPAEEGVLVYIKASLTESVQDASLHQYQATHPAFPHESTGDQFYGEDQFESYRRLGRHLAKHAFGAGLQADDAERILALRPDFSGALGMRRAAG